MLNIDSIQNGIVIDHIQAGKGMRIYELLELDKLDCCVALIKNARSSKLGKKDIIKIEGDLAINFDVLGFIDNNITVCTIKNGELVKKENIVLPRRIKNVVKCKNPRCITRRKTSTRSSCCAMKKRTAIVACTANKRIRAMSKAQRNGAGRRDPEKLKRQKRRDRLFLAFLTFLNFLLALIVRIADRKSVIKAVKQDDKLAVLLEEKTTKSL